MAISGGGPPIPGPTSWEQLSNIASVFSVFIIGGLIPLSIYLYKKYKSMRDYNINKKNDNIKKIATEVSNKLDDKLDEKIDIQSQAIESISNTMDKLSKKLDDQDKQNKAILSTVRSLTKDFHTFKDEQIRVNAKVGYIDQIFRNSLNITGNNSSSGNDNQSIDTKDG